MKYKSSLSLKVCLAKKKKKSQNIPELTQDALAYKVLGAELEICEI